jgi:hypothetical protein
MKKDEKEETISLLEIDMSLDELVRHSARYVIELELAALLEQYSNVQTPVRQAGCRARWLFARARLAHWGLAGVGQSPECT